MRGGTQGCVAVLLPLGYFLAAPLGLLSGGWIGVPLGIAACDSQSLNFEFIAEIKV
jgi:hypothetical protein